MFTIYHHKINYLQSKGIVCYLDRDKRIDNRIGELRIRAIKSVCDFYNLIYTNTNDEIYLNRKKEKFLPLIKYFYGKL